MDTGLYIVIIEGEATKGHPILGRSKEPGPISSVLAPSQGDALERARERHGHLLSEGQTISVRAESSYESKAFFEELLRDIHYGVSHEDFRRFQRQRLEYRKKLRANG